MADAQVQNVTPTPRVQKIYKEFSRGMNSVHQRGEGFALLSGGRLSDVGVVKQKGVSEFQDTANSEAMIFLNKFQKTDGTFQIIKAHYDTDDLAYKLRAVDEAGAEVVPSGGAGDVDFVGGIFSFVQVGLFGYVFNSDGTSFWKWDGTTLTAIAGGVLSDVKFAFKEGRRLSAESGANVLFSRNDLAEYTAWVGGTGSDTNDQYRFSTPSHPTAGLSAGGGSVIFSEQGAELHKIAELSDGTGLFDETRILRWNYKGKGVASQSQVTESSDFIYIVNDTGIIEINPTTGQDRNLITGSGSMEKYWKTYDKSSAVIQYSPKERFVVVALKEIGAANNDRLVIYDTFYQAFYIRLGTPIASMVVVNNQLYGGSSIDGRLFKLFDDDTFVGVDSVPVKSRTIIEWDRVTEIHFEKILKKLSFFMSLNPESTATGNVYVDGKIDPIGTTIFTTTDATNTGDVIDEMAEYVMGEGAPDVNDNSLKVQRYKKNQKFGTVAIEIVETSIYDFQFGSALMEYKTRDKLYRSKQFANLLF